MKNTKKEKQEARNLPAKQEQAAFPVRGSENFFPFTAFRPFSFMRRFTDDMERMFEDFHNLGSMRRFEGGFDFPSLPEFEKALWTPQIEVTENNGQMTVRADLPGLKKEDINIELRDDSLVISGERKKESKEEGEGYYRSERSYGSFYRSIPLPEGADMDKATALFNNGVLEVTVAVPKIESKGRKLEITETSEKSRAKAA